MSEKPNPEVRASWVKDDETGVYELRLFHSPTAEPQVLGTVAMRANVGEGLPRFDWTAQLSADARFGDDPARGHAYTLLESQLCVESLLVNTRSVHPRNMPVRSYVDTLLLMLSHVCSAGESYNGVAQALLTAAGAKGGRWAFLALLGRLPNHAGFAPLALTASNLHKAAAQADESWGEAGGNTG